MAFDEYQAGRIKRIFKDRNASFVAKRMMGGLCFMSMIKCVQEHISINGLRNLYSWQGQEKLLMKKR